MLVYDFDASIVLKKLPIVVDIITTSCVISFVQFLAFLLHKPNN